MNTEHFRRLTTEAVSIAESFDARERDLAAAAEQLSQDPAVRAAFQQGIEHERQRMLTLISIQLDLLRTNGTAAMVLRALRRQVVEPAA